MSISCRSWLNLLSVTPVSVVEKNDIGELHILAQCIRKLSQDAITLILR